MAAEQDELPPIEPLHGRWEPNPIPSTIEVQGLDTTAPVQDQIEQIEQLITIKLQNIDANFARAHQILSTKILPAVRRYAVNTEPVREAARFWVSFYEQAAQVRIPTSDDFSADLGQQASGSGEEEDEVEAELRQECRTHSETFDPNVTPSESSFAPESAAVSSTPMIHGAEREQGDETHDMWATSMESPLKRLDKGLKSLGEEEEDSVIDYSAHASNATVEQSVRSEAPPTRPPIFTAQDKGKGKAPPTLLQNVLSKTIRGADKEKNTSPLKIKKSPRKNPYVPPDIRRADWDGIVDLTKPSTPRAAKRSNPDWSSDEEDYPPPNLSPPRSAFAKRITQIGRTPVREAAARIGRDLVDAERVQLRHRYGAGLEPSETETLSTPSLSMYTRRAMGMESSEKSSTASHTSGLGSDTQPSMDSMMCRFGFDSNKYGGDPSQGQDSGAGEVSFDSFDDMPGPVFANLDALEQEGGGDVSGDVSSSDDDSFGGAPGAPSAAFLMASARQNRTLDDSFDGSDRSSDSLDADDDTNAGPVIHPFAAFNNIQDDDGFDDSLDANDGGASGQNGEEEPTVFGVPPAQRASGSGGRLQLLGQGLVDDTTALNSHLRPHVLPETPTPWTGAGQPPSRP